MRNNLYQSRRRRRITTKVNLYVEKIRDKLHRTKRSEYEGVPRAFALSNDSEIQFLLDLDDAKRYDVFHAKKERDLKRRQVTRPASLELFDDDDTFLVSCVYYKSFTRPRPKPRLQTHRTKSILGLSTAIPSKYMDLNPTNVYLSSIQEIYI